MSTSLRNTTFAPSSVATALTKRGLGGRALDSLENPAHLDKGPPQKLGLGLECRRVYGLVEHIFSEVMSGCST